MYVSPVTPTGGYRLSGTLNGTEISLLLDTGAAVTLLRADTWSQITAKTPQQLRSWSTVTLVSAGGTPLTIHGCACVELELEGNTFMTDIVVVSPLTAEAILGLDFLQEQQASIDLANKTLHLREKGCDIPLRDPTPSHQSSAVQLVRAVRTVEVPPGSSMEISASTNVAVEGVWLLEEASDKCLLFAVARALVEPTSTTIPVCILNSSEEPVTVYAGMVLATLQGIETPTGEVGAVSGGEPVAAVDAEKQEMLWHLAEKSGPDLSPSERDMFYHLLLSYADVMACSTSDLGRTSKLRHHVYTGDTPPCGSLFAVSHHIVVKRFAH